MKSVANSDRLLPSRSFVLRLAGGRFCPSLRLCAGRDLSRPSRLASKTFRPCTLRRGSGGVCPTAGVYAAISPAAKCGSQRSSSGARKFCAGRARVGTLEEYIARFGTNSDTVVVRTGGVLRDLMARVDELAADEAALRGVSAWARPLVFQRYFDREIVRDTWAVFRPARPATLEGLTYAFVGVGLALVLYHRVVKWPLRGLLRDKASVEAALHPPKIPSA